jgi:hypothetical protein
VRLEQPGAGQRHRGRQQPDEEQADRPPEHHERHVNQRPAQNRDATTTLVRGSFWLNRLPERLSSLQTSRAMEI